MTRYWLGVASADHVASGLAGSFMQVNHGKAAPLRRLAPGDGIVYYSPTQVFGTKDGLKSFTAIGAVKEGEPYQGDMGGGFKPFRRDVVWREATPAAIEPLLDRLDLTRNRPNWGYTLRFGLIEIGETDFTTIANAMAAETD